MRPHQHDTGDQTQDRRQRILEGARSTFLRFGFQHASMADIASGAGVSRTALYHYFPNKEEVLRAVVDAIHARSLREAAEALNAAKTLDAALVGLLEAWFGRVLAAITESPHGVELEDAGHRLTVEATREAAVAFHQLVVQAFIQHGRADDAAPAAETLVAAARGLMRSGDVHVSKDTFDARVRRLVAWAVK